MDSGSISESSLNLSTPWIFLSPEVSTKLAIGIYFHVGALAVLIWDLLYHLRTDIGLGLKCKFGPATAAFILSRISILVYAFGRVILLTTPVKQCEELQSAMLPFLALCVACMTFISCLRVCAVYGHHKGIVGGFGLLWAAAVVAISLTVHNISAGTIGPTDYCIETVIDHRFVQAGPIALLVFDTVVFAAMTYRFYSSYQNELLPRDPSLGVKTRCGFGTAIFGSALPAFSKALLHECQFYYLVGPMTKISLIVCMYAISGPKNLPFWVMLISSHLILVNIVTCAVFRNVKGMAWKVNATEINGERSGDKSSTNGKGRVLPDRLGATSLGELKFRTSDCNQGLNLHHAWSDHPYEVSVKVDKVTTVSHDGSFFESISERGEKSSLR